MTLWVCWLRRRQYDSWLINRAEKVYTEWCLRVTCDNVSLRDELTLKNVWTIFQTLIPWHVEKSKTTDVFGEWTATPSVLVCCLETKPKRRGREETTRVSSKRTPQVLCNRTSQVPHSASALSSDSASPALRKCSIIGLRKSCTPQVLYDLTPQVMHYASAIWSDSTSP